MKIRTLICPLLLLALVAFPHCRQKDAQERLNEQEQAKPIEKASVLYAKGFSVFEHGSFTEITVTNPWDTARILQRYLLVRKGDALPEGLPQGTLVRIPVTSFACFSGVQITMLEMLGCQKAIRAVTEPEYISAPFIGEGITNGTIVGLGPASSMNIEKLLDVSPGAILATPFRNAGYGVMEKAGIPILECADYMEDSPLGQAEWIKFVARFVDRTERADSLFNALSERYHALCRLAEGVEPKPTLFSEKKMGQVWFIAGNRSVAARGFTDAGADYLFSDIEGTGSVPFSFESVYTKAAQADIWLIKYNRPQGDLTYQTLREEFASYAYFKAFRQRKILACNTGRKPYYEKGLLEPDVVLADMIHALHRSLLPDYKPVYFDFLQE